MAEYFNVKQGRWFVWDRAHKKKRLRARVIAEASIGRPLATGEVVHHINGNPADDRPENLRVYPNHIAHMRDAHPNPTPPPIWAGALGGRPEVHDVNVEREVVRLRERGKSYAQIARELSLPFPSTVQHLLTRADRTDLMPGLHRPSADSKAAARELRQSGLTYDQIGKALGVSRGTAHAWVTRP